MEIVRGNYPEGNCRRWEMSVGKYPGGSFPGGNCPRWELSGSNCPEGNCRSPHPGLNKRTLFGSGAKFEWHLFFNVSFPSGKKTKP